MDVQTEFVEQLKLFGIEVNFNEADKKVTVTKWNPVNMIDWSDMQKADIIAVGGTGLASTIIKNGTWSISSHTALYEGDNYVIESLNNGPTRRTKDEFTAPSEGVNLMLVKRHYAITPFTALKVVNAAADNVSFGVPPMGKHPMRYNWLGLASAGMSTTTGQVINTFTMPIFPGGVAAGISGLNDANTLARKAANATPAGLEIFYPSVGAAKKIFGGPKGRTFCSEGVIIWYNEAGIPITQIPPDHVPPKFIAEDFFKGVLSEVGYLRFMM